MHRSISTESEFSDDKYIRREIVCDNLFERIGHNKTAAVKRKLGCGCKDVLIRQTSFS